MPKNIPVLSWLFNKYFSQLPVLRKLCVVRFIVARPHVQVSILNVFLSPSSSRRETNEATLKQPCSAFPKTGIGTEIIFVEGGSRDETLDEIKRVVKLYNKKRTISFCVQSGTGKANAVREGFARATGDILMILDADLKVAPEDLPKFYYALAANRGEFVSKQVEEAIACFSIG